jgi:hypothetical protein
VIDRLKQAADRLLWVEIGLREANAELFVDHAEQLDGVHAVQAEVRDPGIEVLAQRDPREAETKAFPDVSGAIRFGFHKWVIW